MVTARSVVQMHLLGVVGSLECSRIHDVAAGAAHPLKQLFAHRSSQHFIRKINDMAGNTGTRKEHRALVAEVIAVIGKQIVFLWSEPRSDIVQKLQKEILRQLGVAQVDGLDRSAVRSLACWAAANTASVVEFLE